MKDKMKVVFIHVSSLLLIGLTAALIAQIPPLNGTELLWGMLGTAYGFGRLKQLVSKLPGLQ